MSQSRNFYRNAFAGNLKFLVLLWAVINAFFLFRKGIVADGEAIKYIFQANYLLEYGTMETNNFWFYSTQIFLLAVSIKFNISQGFVIAVQLLLNLLALGQFHNSLLKKFNERLAVFGSLFLLLNIPLQEFNTYLQTESIFYSISIILFSHLLTIEKLNLSNTLRAILLLLLLCVTRPTGLLFVPAFAVFTFLKQLSGAGFLRALGVLGMELVIFFLLLNIGLGSGGEFDFMLPFRYEHIICGVPTLNTQAAISLPDNPNSISGFLFYLTHNSSQFISLAARRTIAFWGLYRSHYSVGHNLLLILFFYPQYFAALLSLKTWKKKDPAFLGFSICSLSIVWISVMFSCDDWHNRFFLSVAMIISILAIPFWKKLFNRNPHANL